MLPLVKFAEDKVLVFVILCEKMLKQCNSESNHCYYYYYY